MGAFLALASSLSWGVADFLGGMASRRAGAVQVLAVSYPAGGLVITLMAMFVIPGHLSMAVVPYAVVAGLLGAVAIGLFYAAMNRGPMGVISPITAVMSGIVPVAAGLFRGESISLIAAAGMVVAFVAVIMVSRENAHPHERTPLIAIVLALIAGFAIGCYLTAIGLAPADSGVWAATLARWFSTVVMIFILLVIVRSFSAKGFPWALAIIAGLLDAGANGLFQLAAQRGLLAIVAVIGALYPASTVLLARFLLHERMNRVQVTGVVLAFLAITALALN